MAEKVPKIVKAMGFSSFKISFDCHCILVYGENIYEY